MSKESMRFFQSLGMLIRKRRVFYHIYFLHLYNWGHALIGVARTGSVYLTMSVTLERYFAIVRPLSSFYMKRWLVPISIVFAIFYNFPRFFELERYIFLPTNETLVRGTTLRQNQLYISVYNTWMKMVSTFPFFCMKMTGFFLPFVRIWLN